MTPDTPLPGTGVDLRALRRWIGRTENLSARLDSVPAAGMHALLDLAGPPPGPGDALPHAWHWLYFHQPVRQSALAPDGHAARGGFLPPVPLPRRMWAGGRFRFVRPLRIGDMATRQSEVIAVDAKTGRSGRLVFVTVRHRLSDGDGVCVDEDHDIVYRDPPPAATAAAAAPRAGATAPADWRRIMQPDAVMLFRYSALTFNSHRIHYDRTYASAVEGYPGLIVHGPLMTTLMLDLLRYHRPDRPVTRFAYRALEPVFDTETIAVCGRAGADGGIVTWVEGEDGRPRMRGAAGID